MAPAVACLTAIALAMLADELIRMGRRKFFLKLRLSLTRKSFRSADSLGLGRGSHIDRSLLPADANALTICTISKGRILSPSSILFGPSTRLRGGFRDANAWGNRFQ